MNLHDRLEATREYLAGRLPVEPAVAVVLGSGLSFLGDEMSDGVAIPFGEIPHFPESSVPGHQGKLVAGTLGGIPALLFCGRVHLYEGYSPEEVTFGVRTAIRLGVTRIVLTNAAGTVHPVWTPGDIMLLKDHLNLQACNVLCGQEDLRIGERFVDMTDVYSAALRDGMRRWSAGSGVPLREGVYAGLLGPSYETRAEVNMIRHLGADAVGMSTVQEAIAARQMGAEVMGFSVITNLAAGVSPHPLSHDEVKETADRVKETFARVIKASLAIA